MATIDLRSQGSASPIAKYQFDQVSWATGDGHAAKTAVRKGVNMLIERVDVLISSVTANPTVTITWADENSIVILDGTNFASLADGTNHLLLSTKSTADFDAIPVNNDITITVDPSADPGGADQTLTVTVLRLIAMDGSTKRKLKTHLPRLVVLNLS